MMYMGVTRRSLLASYISCMTRFRKQRWNSNFYSNHYCGRCCIRSFLFRYGIMLRWWRHKKQGSDSQLTKRSRGSHTTVMDTFIFYHFRGNPKSISTFKVGIHNHPKSFKTVQNCHCSNIVWKSLKMSHLNFWILAFSTNFCPIRTDLSGNTVWQQAWGFQKLAKIEHFWHF